VAAINVHMFTRLELVPQVEMSNLMGDSKALSIGGIVHLNGNDAGVPLAYEQARDILAQFSIGNPQTQVPRHPLNIDGRFRKTAGFRKGFTVKPG